MEEARGGGGGYERWRGRKVEEGERWRVRGREMERLRGGGGER